MKQAFALLYEHFNALALTKYLQDVAIEFVPEGPKIPWVGLTPVYSEQFPDVTLHFHLNSSKSGSEGLVNLTFTS